jgi:hypothetical protein
MGDLLTLSAERGRSGIRERRVAVTDDLPPETAAGYRVHELSPEDHKLELDSVTGR